MPRAIWALLLAFSSSYAHAAPEGSPLSLPDALRFAVERSPIVRRARKEHDVVAAARVGAAALLPANPIIGVALGTRRDTSGSVPPSRGFEGTGRLEQQIEIGGQRGARIAEADRAKDVARIRVDIALIEARARVRAAYVGVLLAERHLAHAREQEALGGQVLASAQARVTAGAGTDIDLHLAEVERGRLTQERVLAVLGVEEALSRLRHLVGLPLGSPLVLTSALDLPAPLTETFDALLLRAHERRAELRMLDASATQLDATIVRLHRERIPNPTLSFDVMSQQPGQLYLGGGLAIPLPLWRRGQGELAVAQANKALQTEERALFEDELALEVEQAERKARLLREAIDVWQRVSLPAAEQHLGLVTQGWRAGKLDLFRVVQAAREAADARRRELELAGALWDATITLQRATGSEELR